MTVAAARPEVVASARASEIDAREPGPRAARPDDDGVVTAARRFEALLLAQLLKEMRKTVPDGAFGGSGATDRGGAASQYMAMFDDAVAEALASGGGVGLAAMLAEGLGASPDAVRAATAAYVRPRSPLAAAPPPQTIGSSSPTGTNASAGMRVAGVVFEGGAPEGLAPLPGGHARLAAAAAELLRGGADRWSREGRLDATLLASPIATVARDGGVARFNVEDARGFEGSYKCNLFALEAARRAGYTVPLRARPRGWGFPAPDGIVRDAEDGRLRDDWARLATGMDGPSLQRAIGDGRGFLLAGSGTAGHAGHMAVVERVHEVRYDREGVIERVVFDGWEARARGAERVLGRVWCRAGHPQPGARNGLGRIEIVELREPEGPFGPELPQGTANRGSLKDGPRQAPPSHGTSGISRMTGGDHG
jgi:Rod binding domain-containing protein